MVNLTREEILDIMIEVMSDKALHIRASKGYKYTGTTNAFDGSEDHKICRDARIFWRENRMRPTIDVEVKRVEEDFRKGKLSWNYQTVMGLIRPFPARGKLDKLVPGQEDEATPAPDGVPWEVEGGMPGQEETRGGGEEDNMNEHELEEGGSRIRCRGLDSASRGVCCEQRWGC